MKKGNNVLILTSSGGSGLLNAAKAQAQCIQKDNPHAKIVIKDVLVSDRWNLLGKFGASLWNFSQKIGWVFCQKLLGKWKILAEYIFWPQIFFEVSYILEKEKIDRVIDTQVLSSSATLLAIRRYNKKNKKNLILEKVIVDIPSYQNTLFFRPIKKLSSRQKKEIKLISIKPFLEKERSTAEFWKNHCGVDESIVEYTDFPIRLGFHPYIGKPKPCMRQEFLFRIPKEKENQMVLECLKKGPVSYSRGEKDFLVIIQPLDYVYAIVLGSQPTSHSTIQYVSSFIEIAKNNLDRQIQLFVFASSLHSKNSLFHKVYDLSLSNTAPNLSIVPFSLQEEDVIAKMFFRADGTITRSAGQTVLELMATAPKTRYIHSESKRNECVFQGMPGWEAGGARYIQETFGAVVVTPETFLEKFSL